MEEISNLRKLQLEELNLLKIFAGICEKNHLRYYLLGGTLLGAIRHKGFIPWDDDVDVCMPRKDYEVFLKIVEKELEKPYYLSCLENNPEYRYCFARLATSAVKIRNHSANIPRVEDAWIDIIPMDGMPEGFAEKIQKLRLMFRRGLNQIAQYDELVDQKRKRGKVEALVVKMAGWKPLRKLVNYKKTTRKIQEVLKRYPYDGSRMVINYMAAYGFQEYFPEKSFGEGARYLFEDQEFIGPVDYDQVLRQIYGEYMELPPEDQRNKHNAEIIQI